MKAMLIILIVTGQASGGKAVESIQVPVSTYEHCIAIADRVGESIAIGLGDYAKSVSTECVNQGEIK